MSNNTTLWVLVFYIAIVLLSTPIWWRETRIYRADLPLLEIDALSRSLQDTPQVLIKIRLVQVAGCAKYTNDELLAFFAAASSKQHQHREHDLYDPVFSISDKSCIDLSIELQKNWSINDLDVKLQEIIASGAGEFDIVMLYGYSERPEIHLSPYRRFIVLLPELKDDADTRDHANDALTIISNFVFESNYVGASRLNDQRAIRISPEIRLTFTLMTGGADVGVIASWPFAETIGSDIRKLTQLLSHVASFTIDSQVRHFVPMLVAPKQGDDGAHYLDAQVLPYVLPHPNEWNDDLTATRQPSLHFIVYLPSGSYTPLHVRDEAGNLSETNAFLIARTGGVAFLSVNITTDTEVTLPNDHLRSLTIQPLKEVSKVFIAQLRSLLGVPDWFDKHQYLTSVMPSASGIALWEVDMLGRRAYCNYRTTVIESLQSLAAVTEKIQNMGVPDHIKDTVDNAIRLLQKAQRAAAVGEYKIMITSARDAAIQAEKAFFDSEMLGVQYNPPNHKLAIYTPLFLPILVPIATRIVSAFKTMRRKKRELSLKKHQ